MEAKVGVMMLTVAVLAEWRSADYSGHLLDSCIDLIAPSAMSEMVMLPDGARLSPSHQER